MNRYLWPLIFIILISCGTETGNPFTTSSGNSGEAPVSDGTTTMIYQVVVSSCKKIAQCYSSNLSESTCISKVLSDGKFDTELGLSDGIYNTTQEMINAETANSITPNQSESDQCKADISALNCSDSEVVNAYDISSPNDFGSLFEIIPTGAGSCNDIFN